MALRVFASVLMLAILLIPPTNVVLDPAGVSFDAPIAGRYCATVYQADWTGDHRSACVDMETGAGRIDLPIAAGEHVFLSRINPFVEIGPFSLPFDPPVLRYDLFLPGVVRSLGRDGTGR